MQFWLGTHQPHWLRRYRVPMMVSRRTLARYKTKPRALAPWFRDSGGFTELRMYGNWNQQPAAQFVAEARRDMEEVGAIAHMAPRDWMCEPLVISGGAGFVGTQLTVAEHQRRTVADFLDLSSRAPELPWVPVVQGWTLDDYLHCLELYDRAGIDLASYALVGVGTICRRQGTIEGRRILQRLSSEGLRLHAFGLKTDGIPLAAKYITSSDSLAWSYDARRSPPLPGCTTHKNCANCHHYAFRWLAKIHHLIAAQSDRGYQLALAI